MIIDIAQNRESIDISYIDENRNIAVETVNFDGAELKGPDGSTYVREYHNFVECDEYDSEKFEGLTSLNGNSIKLEKSRRFEGHNINYFLGIEIPKYMPELHAKLEPIRLPKLFSCDIEIDITEKYGYSNQYDVENPIRSISFTGEELNSVLFIVRNEKHPEFDAKDWAYIDGIVADALGQHAYTHEYKKRVLFFNNEREMLEAFIDVTRKYFHTLIGWNFLGYDVQYIFNRCTKLNIDYKRISPTRKTVKLRNEINDRESMTIELPAHRIYLDYMKLFKESLVYNNLGKYSLDAISELILGVKKVSYDGNLKTLYDNDYLRFVAYAYVDTILVMLIHHKVNLVNIDFFQSYYTGVSFNKIGQNSISESLVFKNLLTKNKFMVKTDYSTEEITGYPGGYVKDPTTKLVEAVVGLDFNSLYPNSMITIGISPEMYVDSIKVDDMGYPLNDDDKAKWEQYKSMGYCLCPTGSIYDVNNEGIYTQIEMALLAERKLYKGHKEDLYLNVIPEIEAQKKHKSTHSK